MGPRGVVEDMTSLRSSKCPYGVRGGHSGWSFEMLETCMMRAVVDMGSGGVRWGHVGWGTI